jgi:FkbM family methyltransferase
MLKRTIKRWFEYGLRVSGYELKDLDSPVRGYEGCLEYAKSRGLAPRTVFDVGVGRGTPWLYDAFNNAKLVLFEPLAVFDGFIDELVRRYNADLHRVALAAAPGVAEFHFNTDFPTSSSLLGIDPQFATFAAKVQRNHHFTSQQVRLDSLDRLNNYEPPFVLKIDVEGAELGVLEGARKTLEQTEFIVMEISVERRYSGEPNFARTIAFLDQCGFELFDIPSLAQAGRNGQLIYLDAAFVQKGSRFWPS